MLVEQSCLVEKLFVFKSFNLWAVGQSIWKFMNSDRYSNLNLEAIQSFLTLCKFESLPEWFRILKSIDKSSIFKVPINLEYAKFRQILKHLGNRKNPGNLYKILKEVKYFQHNRSKSHILHNIRDRRNFKSLKLVCTPIFRNVPLLMNHGVLA